MTIRRRDRGLSGDDMGCDGSWDMTDDLLERLRAAPGADDAARRRSRASRACGWSAARCATRCSAATRATSTWWSRATPRGGAARGGARRRPLLSTSASAPRPCRRRRAFDLAAARRERYERPGALPDGRARRDDRGGPRAPRLHRQRDRGAARRRRAARRSPGALRGPRRRGVLRVLHDALVPRRPDAAAAAGPLRARGCGFAVEPDTRELAFAAVEDGALATVTRLAAGRRAAAAARASRSRRRLRRSRRSASARGCCRASRRPRPRRARAAPDARRRPRRTSSRWPRCCLDASAPDARRAARRARVPRAASATRSSPRPPARGRSRRCWAGWSDASAICGAAAARGGRDGRAGRRAGRARAARSAGSTTLRHRQARRSPATTCVAAGLAGPGGRPRRSTRAHGGDARRTRPSRERAAARRRSARPATHERRRTLPDALPLATTSTSAPTCPARAVLFSTRRGGVSERPVRLAQPRPADRRRAARTSTRTARRLAAAVGRAARALPLRPPGPRRDRAPRHRAAAARSGPHADGGRPGDRARRTRRRSCSPPTACRCCSSPTAPWRRCTAAGAALAGGIVAEGVAALRELGARRARSPPRSAPARAAAATRSARRSTRASRRYDARARRAQPRPRRRSPRAQLAGAGRRRRSTTSACARCAAGAVLLPPPRRRRHRPPGGGRMARLITGLDAEPRARATSSACGRDRRGRAARRPRPGRRRAARRGQVRRRSRSSASLAEAGLTLLGENRAQELEAKATAHPEFRWHFIGQLQSRKVKQILPYVELIHSVASDSALRQLEHARHAGDRDPGRGQRRGRGGQGRDRARTSCRRFLERAPGPGRRA